MSKQLRSNIDETWMNPRDMVSDIKMWFDQLEEQGAQDILNMAKKVFKRMSHYGATKKVKLQKPDQPQPTEQPKQNLSRKQV